METAIKKLENIEQMRANLLIMIAAYEAKGFSNCENVVRMKKELAQIQYEKYKDKYPNYLYFTNEQFDEIVKRNKLVISTCETYTGNIPDECFEAIKNENISEEDIRESMCTFRIESTATNRSYKTLNPVPYKVYLNILNGTKEYLEDFMSKHWYRNKKYINLMLYGNEFSEYPSLYSNIRKEATITL